MSRASVCCLSVVCLWRWCILPEGSTFRQYFTPSNSPGTRTLRIKILGKIRRSSRGSFKLNTRGYEKCAFFANISLYFEIGTRCGYSYNGRRIGTRMRSVEWCHFQSPCVTLDLGFKVTIFEYQISRKWCKIEHPCYSYNGKPYKVLYMFTCLRIGAISMTLTTL